MSVLIKSPNNIGGGSSKGFPPGDVNIITKFIANNTLKIKWEDPEDTIINGYTICTWAGTVLVAKEGSCPESIKDGTVLVESTTRNAYKDTYFTCSTTASVLYLRFFTYSTEKVYNNNISILCITAADPILANNSWDVISDIAEAGEASTIWSIGDEIDINYKSSNTITFQIWDFNHFDKSDGSGKAGIVLGAKTIESGGSFSAGRGYQWTKSYFRAYNVGISTPYAVSFFNGLSEELQSVIKEVTIYTNEKISSSNTNSKSAETNDKIFIPGNVEVGLSSTYNCPNQSKFPIFTDNNSRAKIYRNTNVSYASSATYWLRDAYGSGPSFGAVDMSGKLTAYNYNGYIPGFVWCFNV